MAIKQIVPIIITLQGDGASTTFVYALQNLYQAGVGGSIPYGGGSTVVPSSANVSVISPSIAITSTIVDANGNVTITFTSAPTNGVQYSLELDLIFNSGAATSSSPTQTQNVNITGGTITVGGTVAVTQSTSPWVVSGTVTANAGTGNFTVVQATAASLNATVVGTGTFAVQAAQSGTWTVQQGTPPWSQNLTQLNSVALGSPSAYGTSPGAVNVLGVNAFITNTPAVTQSGNWTTRIVGNAGATLDGTITAGTAPANGVAQLGVYDTTQPAPTNGQSVALQIDQAGNLLTYPGVQTKTGSVWNSGTAGGTFQFPTGTVTVGQPLGSSAVIVQLDQSAGTFTAGAVTFQGTYDGSNWVSIPVAQLLNPQTFAQLTNPYTFVTSTNQPFLIVLQGFQQVRLNLSSAITGTGTVTPNWTVLPYTIAVPGSAASSVNIAQVNGSTVSTAATGVQKVGIVGNTGAALDGVITAATAPANAIATLGVFNSTLPTLTTGQSAAIQVDAKGQILSDLNYYAGTALTGTVTAYGTAPTGNVFGVNSFVTNTVTVSGTVTANQGGAPWSQNLTQVAGTVLGATAVTAFGTAPAAANVPGVNASIYAGTAALAAVNTNCLKTDWSSEAGTAITTVPVAFGTGTPSGNAPGVNAALFAGTTALTAATFGTTAAGTGVLTNASLFIGTTVAVAASAGVQKVGISGATGVTLDAAQAATAPANAVSVSGTFNNATGTTGALAAGQASAIQLDSHGLVLCDIASANGAAMSASNGVLTSIVQGGNTAAVKAASTAAVAADQALVVAISPNTPIAVGQAGTSNTAAAAWTSATANNTAVTLTSATFAYDALVVTFNQTTTITGGAANFEVSNDNSNWNAIGGVSPTGGSAQTSYTFVASTYAAFVFNVSGWQYFRVRLSPAITGTGTVTVGYAAQSTANAPIIVRDSKDTGRTYIVWFVDAITAVTTEALISIAVNKGGTGQSSATTYTVSTGKTLRLQSLSSSIQETNSTVQYLKVRVRAGTTVTTSSQIVAGMLVASSGSTNAAGYGEQTIPDGVEIAGGQQVGISHVSGSTNANVTICLIGYEY